MLVIPPAMLTSHLAKASSCSSSASAGGVANQRALAGKASLQRPPVQTGDHGCSSGSVAVGGTNGGTSCFAANNGQGQLANNAAAGGSLQSCSASNQRQAFLGGK
jgi:hypothetical protein